VVSEGLGKKKYKRGIWRKEQNHIRKNSEKVSSSIVILLVYACGGDFLLIKGGFITQEV
jgi:hypothetical protein